MNIEAAGLVVKVFQELLSPGRKPNMRGLPRMAGRLRKQLGILSIPLATITGGWFAWALEIW